jgi:glycosyltransferase involved in cell wall biosynthesis
VPPADAGALAEKILLLAMDDRRRSDMGQAARKRIEGQFDWPIIAGQYMDIIRAVTSGREQ